MRQAGSNKIQIQRQIQRQRQKQRQIQSQRQLGGIAKAAIHKCPGKSSLDVNYICPKQV